MTQLERASMTRDIHTLHRPHEIPTSKQILLAADAGPAELALRRAAAYGREAGAELHVLCVLGRGQPFVRSRGELTRDIGGEARVLDQALASYRFTRAACNRILGPDFPEYRIQVRIGSFVETVSRHMLEVGAGLLILPAELQHARRTAARLARERSRPVLVVRRPALRRAFAAFDGGRPEVRAALAEHFDWTHRSRLAAPNASERS